MIVDIDHNLDLNQGLEIKNYTISDLEISNFIEMKRIVRVNP